MSVEIIAEVGVNAEGSLDTAMQLAQAAHEAGADAVKFQKFGMKTHANLKKYMLTDDEWMRLFTHCREISIEPFASVFHPDDVELMETLDVKRYKIAKGMGHDAELFTSIYKTGKPIIISVDAEVGTKSNYGKALHCVGKYPTHISETLLGNVPIFDGYSSHTGKIEDCIAAAALGAQIIEVHIMFLGCTSPDKESSITVEQFSELVRKVRLIT